MLWIQSRSPPRSKGDARRTKSTMSVAHRATQARAGTPAALKGVAFIHALSKTAT